jgi:hypothetical protein
MLNCHYKNNQLSFEMTRREFDDAEYLVSTLKQQNYSRLFEIFKEEINTLNCNMNIDHNIFHKKNYALSDGCVESGKLIYDFLQLKRLNHPEIKVVYEPDGNLDELYDDMKSYAKTCRMTDCNNKGTSRCTRCGWAKYCSVECQKSHWGIHKDHCIQKKT